MTEIILPYDHSIVPQETGWWCGPASCQTVCNGRGVIRPERDFMHELEAFENHPWVEDDQGGTNDIHQITAVLNNNLGSQGAKYVTRTMPVDPPTEDQRNLLWDDIRRSINAGFGVVVNVVAPPPNYPKGVKGSASPAYRGGDVYHYFTVMGYADDYPGGAGWCGDSGFPPFGYWIAISQLATLIPPKGYSCSPTGPLDPAPARDEAAWNALREQSLGVRFS